MGWLDRLALAATAYPAGLIVLHAVQLLAPQDDGPVALGQIVAPHLTLAALLLVPLAARPRAWLLRRCLVVLGIVFLVRFGGEWLSSPRFPTDAPSLDVVTWNLEFDARSGDDAIAALLDHPADIVALQELTRPISAAIDADPALLRLYPYRALDPSGGSPGMGVLSRYPITATAYRPDPSRQELTLDVDGRSLFVINGHPYPARQGPGFAFDTRVRNAELDLVRRRAIESIAAGVPTLVLGDFNTASSEPAFGRFVAGLTDAHAEVGLGPGWTWRPSQLEDLGVAVLRIDLILSGAGIVPISMGTDCSRIGDHCLVEGHLELR